MLIEDRNGQSHDPLKVAEFLDGRGDVASEAIGEALHDAADVVLGLHHRLEYALGTLGAIAVAKTHPHAFAAKELQAIARKALGLGPAQDRSDRRERLHDGSGRSLPGRAVQVVAGQPLCETPNGRIAPTIAEVTCKRCLHLGMRAV
jgi:hypothetical protein